MLSRLVIIICFFIYQLPTIVNIVLRYCIPKLSLTLKCLINYCFTINIENEMLPKKNVENEMKKIIELIYKLAGQ